MLRVSRGEKHVSVVLITAVFSQTPVSAQKDQDSDYWRITYINFSLYILASVFQGSSA